MKDGKVIVFLIDLFVNVGWNNGISLFVSKLMYVYKIKYVLKIVV